MTKILSLCAAMLLLLCLPALAQEALPEPAEEIETVEVTYDVYTDEDWGLTAFIPDGGDYYAPEDLGIMPGDDPMNYPLIWITTDASRPFIMVMFGALPMEEEITDDYYGVYFDEFLGNVRADFPELVQEVDAVDIHDRIWDRFVVADSEGATMINYLTYVDDVFYSISFVKGDIEDLGEALDATAMQLDVMYIEGDLVPEDDILLPWYF